MNLKNRNLIESFSNSVNGIIYTVKTEKNMRIHTVAAAIILLLSLFYHLAAVEMILLVFTITLVLVCEMINTAVEIVVDIIVDVYHPKAKNAKDVAAGAVLVSASASVIVGYYVFLKRIEPALKYILISLKHWPILIILIIIASLIIIVFLVKSLIKNGIKSFFELLAGIMLLAIAVFLGLQLFI